MAWTEIPDVGEEIRRLWEKIDELEKMLYKLRERVDEIKPEPALWKPVAFNVVEWG